MAENALPTAETVLPIAVIGDVHGAVASLAHGAAHAFSAGVPALIQVGDYWRYESRYARNKVDRTLESLAGEAGLDPDEIHLYFCDGNHEHFDTLDPDAAQPVPLSDHVTYVPRGVAVTIAELRVGFCGGAESVDRARRTPGIHWWPEERMTKQQIDRALDMGPVDILITHDTSSGVFERLAERGGHPLGKLAFGKTEREAITEILAATQPKWHVHGHHHTWGLFSTTNGSVATTTVSLAADGRAGATALLGRDSSEAFPAPDRRAGPPHGLDLSVTPVK